MMRDNFHLFSSHLISSHHLTLYRTFNRFNVDSPSLLIISIRYHIYIMPSEKKGQLDVVEKIVFDTAYNAVVTLSVFASNTVLNSTGFIVDIVMNRIIVLTCAHNILATPKAINSVIYPTITAKVTGSYQAGSHIRNEMPIVISLRLLGMNISGDVAVLYSILPSEEDDESLLGYRFSKRTHRLSWASRPALYGETVYTIGNMYGSNLSMIAGNCADNNSVYNPESTVYLNRLQHITTTLAVKGGVSGAPIIYYDDVAKRAVICGIVQRSKVDNDYTVGLNLISLQKNYRRIYDLNISCQTIKPNRLNFNGSTGKGYSGVLTYEFVTEGLLTQLNNKYQQFNQSKYRNRIGGIMITLFSNPTTQVIPNSGVAKARNISRCDYMKRNTRALAISNNNIELLDILMEVDGQRLGDEDQDVRLALINMYDAGKVHFIKCLKPSTATVQYYKYISDQYPEAFESVTVDPDIELLCGGDPPTEP